MVSKIEKEGLVDPDNLPTEPVIKRGGNGWEMKKKIKFKHKIDNKTLTGYMNMDYSVSVRKDHLETVAVVHQSHVNPNWNAAMSIGRIPLKKKALQKPVADFFIRWVRGNIKDDNDTILHIISRYREYALWFEMYDTTLHKTPNFVRALDVARHNLKIARDLGKSVEKESQFGLRRSFEGN